MKIIALIDPETFAPDDPQFEQGLDHVLRLLEYHVVEALRILGHTVDVMPFELDILQTLQQIVDTKPDLIFNLTEHFRGDRQMDMNIASLLELSGYPYTGTGPSGLLLCRDKALAKTILNHHRVKVPDFASLPVGTTRLQRRMDYPMIVKPALMDGSDGISRSSIVFNETELAERAEMLHSRTQQPVICEAFVHGREIYVGVLGNRQLTVLPARELRFDASAEEGPKIATARVKLDEAYRKKWNIQYTFAELDPEMERKIARVCKRIYRVLHLRDYARIDLRISPEGVIYCLEANPNPDLTMGDELSEAAERAGISYEQLIARIVHQARRRTRQTVQSAA